MSSLPPQMFRFKDFEVNLASGEVHENGAKIKIQEKPLLVLAALAEHAERVVTREELEKRIWPADTFVDFDNGLNVAVRKLRLALRDSGSVPPLVETVRRRGYRLNASVQHIPESASPPSVTEVLPLGNLAQQPAPVPDDNPLPSSRTKPLAWIVIAFAILASLPLMSVSRKQEEPPRLLNAVPWNSLPAPAESPSFSRDGQMLTFPWDGNRSPLEPQFDVQPVKTSSPPLDSLLRGVTIAPAWSRDGKWIAEYRNPVPATISIGRESPSSGSHSLCALTSLATICSPLDGATVQSPMQLIAGTNDFTPVKLIQVYIDGKKSYQARLAAIDVRLPVAVGTHRVTLQALDTSGIILKKTINVTVVP